MAQAGIISPASGKRMSGRAWIPGWAPACLLFALILAIPVLTIVASVAHPSTEVWAHLADTVLPRYLETSFWLITGVGIGTFVIGVGTAWLVTMYRFPGRKYFEWALLLPFAMPAYILAYTYTGMFEFSGPVQTGLREIFGWQRGEYWFPQVRTLGGAIWMLTFVLYPYVYLLARASFIEQSVCVFEVSRTLGRTRFRTFLTVGIPLARPGIAAGLSFAMIETLNDYGTVQYFAVDSLTAGIFRTWIGLGDPVAAQQLAAIIMGFVFVVILLERWSRGRGTVRPTTTRHQRLPEFRPPRGTAWIATAACFLPILLGFLLPCGVLAIWALETAPEMVDANFLTYAFNSFLLAFITALLAVAAGLFLAYGQRLQPGWLMNISIRICSLGYAVPGAVIGVGVIVAYAAIDQAIGTALQSWFGVSPGLIVSGTIAGVVIAYLVRFLAVSMNTVEAGLVRITPSMDAAARTLGKRPGEILRKVHAPLMKGSVLTAGMLVFVDVMKELPATFLLRPLGFDTLAIRAYQLASDERLADSSSAAIAIVLVGIIPVILLSISIAKSRAGHSHE